MSLTLKQIARALGGEVSGGQVLAPSPGHSAKDRGMAVKIGRDGEPIVHLFNGGDPLAAKDDVCRSLGLEPFKPKGQANPARPRHAVESTTKHQDNASKAAWLWRRREPVSECNPAWLYLRKRGYSGQFPATLGYLPPNGKHPPAMIAAFGFCDEPEPGVLDPPANVIGVHITRLTPDGRKAPIDPVKIMLGVISGLPVVLAPVNDGLGLAITEGIEDGLSVFEETGLGVWAAGSAGNMPKIAAALPSYVECITIFAHRDETGMRFAKEAARLIAAMKVEVHIKGRG